MALFFECMPQCAQKLLDTADIVRDAIFRQLRTISIALLKEFSRSERPPTRRRPGSREKNLEVLWVR